MSDRAALDRLIAAETDETVKAALTARLEAGEDPAGILASIDSGDLLSALAGNPLSDDEADALFDRVLAEVDADEAPTAQHDQVVPQAGNNTRWLLPLLMVAVALFAVVPGVVMPPEQPYTGIKGNALGTLTLFEGDGQGGVKGPLTSREVPRGTPILFRYTLLTEARVQLKVREGDRITTVWSTDAVQPAGDYEVEANGQALAWTVEGPVTFALFVDGQPTAWLQITAR